MKILYIHRTQGRGAEGVHITSVVTALRNLGHTVDVLSPPGVDPFSTAGDSPVDKVEIRATGIHRLWKFVSRNLPEWMFELLEVAYNFYLLPMIVIRLSRGKYDFLFERYAFLNFAPAAAASLLKVPRAMEINEVCGVKRAREQFFVRLMKAVETYTMNTANALFPVSSFLKEKIVQRGVRKTNIHVLPNAVHSEIFGKSGAGRSTKGKLGVEGKVVIGFAGWFDHWDRLEWLVRIFSEIRHLAPCHLLLIGSGRMIGELRTLIDNMCLSADVTLTGPVPRSEVMCFIDALDIAVITHSNEFGSPMVLFEFIALGKCVIAPKLAPLTDVLEDGKNALLFKPGDWGELRSCLEKAIIQDAFRVAIGRAAREIARKRHTWQANAEAILDAMATGTGNPA